MLPYILIALGVLALPHLVLPLIVRSRFRHYTRPPVTPAELDDLPPQVAQRLDDGDHLLGGLGYRRAALGRLEAMPGVVTWIGVYPDRDAGEIALLSLTEGSPGAPPSRVFEFRSAWVGGRELGTSNLDEVPSFDALRGQGWVTFPGQRDIAHLRDIHRARVRRDAPMAAPQMPAQGEELMYVQNQLAYWVEIMVARRLLKPINEDMHGLTLRGAYGTTWRQLPPTRQRRRRRQVALARRVFESLDLRVPLPRLESTLVPDAVPHVSPSAGEAG